MFQLWSNSSVNLQTWDNIVSIVSNTVTALSVLGGVIFSGSKLQDYLERKNKEVAFSAALSLYEQIISFRREYSQFRIKLNYILDIAGKSHKNKESLTSQEYIEIQEIGIAIFDSSLTIGNLFIKSNNFKTIYSDDALNKIKNILDISKEISDQINLFFNCVLQPQKENKTITDVELAKLYSYSQEYNRLTKEYLAACTTIQLTKFEDFCNFK